MFLLPCFTVFWLYRNSRMPYYVSIKPYNSTVQEFCAVQLRLYGRVGPTHTSKASTDARWRAGILRKNQQILRTESINTCNANRYTNLLHTYSLVATQALSSRAWVTTMLRARIRAQNKNGVQQRGSVWAWL